MKRFVAYSIVARHDGKEKANATDIFFLHNIDGGMLVNVTWIFGSGCEGKAE